MIWPLLEGRPNVMIAPRAAKCMESVHPEVFTPSPSMKASHGIQHTAARREAPCPLYNYFHPQTLNTRSQQSWCLTA